MFPSTLKYFIIEIRQTLRILHVSVRLAGNVTAKLGARKIILLASTLQVGTTLLVEEIHAHLKTER